MACRVRTAEDAYGRYGSTANRVGTYSAWFRSIVKKYPHKSPVAILSDLVRHRPGDEGKWFAAAKEAGLFDEAIALANLTPCDPRTLSRAARGFAEKKPAFATEAGLAALQWLVRGYGYEIASSDVWSAYADTMKAAGNAGRRSEALARIRALVDHQQPSNRAVDIIRRELDSLPKPPLED